MSVNIQDSFSYIWLSLSLFSNWKQEFEKKEKRTVKFLLEIIVLFMYVHPIIISLI